MKIMQIGNCQSGSRYKNNTTSNLNVMSKPLNNQNNISFSGLLVTGFEDLFGKAPSADVIRFRAKMIAEEIERHRLIKMLNAGEPQVGFEKIAGYEDIKAALTAFLVNPIKFEKAGNKVDIPGSILTFGPTGTGKTTLIKAIAEEAGCTIKNIDCGLRVSDKTRNEFIENLEKEAIKAEDQFKQDRTRTIISTDQLTGMVSKESNILELFEKFIKTCSERYHCTIIGKTNHPSQLGVSLEDAKVFPFRIAFNPPTESDTTAIFKHCLDGKTLGSINHDLLASSLTKTGKERGGIYSPSQIENIVHYSAKLGKSGISQQDVLSCIEYGNPEIGFKPPIPALTWENIRKFQADEEAYITHTIL